MGRVLVTGGLGFIGSFLVDRLVAMGEEAWDRYVLELGDGIRLITGRGARKGL